MVEEERLREKNSFERMMGRARRLQGRANFHQRNKMDYEKIKNLSLQGSLLKEKNQQSYANEKKVLLC